MRRADQTDPSNLTLSRIPRADRMALKDRIASSLRAAIFKGEFQPDRVYSVAEFAQTFGTSATPVREALLDLEVRGLIEIVRNVGFRVAVPSNLEVAHLIAARKLVEIPSLLAACGKLRSQTISAARTLLRQLGEAADAGDFVRYMELDRDFHLLLVAEGQNPVVTDMVRQLRSRQWMPALGRLAQSGRLAERNRDHAELLDGLVRGDAEAVTATIGRHLDLNLPDEVEPDRAIPEGDAV